MMVRFFVLQLLVLSVLLFGACGTQPERDRVEPTGTGAGKAVSQQPDSSPAPPPDAPPEKEPALALETVYTDLTEDKCTDVDADEAEEWSVQSCKGVEGYKLRVSEGDLRQTIDVVFPDGSKHELDMWTVVSSGFSTVGDKAEWRIRKADGKAVPVALIVRYNVNADPEDTEKITSYLTVTKITANDACITDVIQPVKNANLRARELAETAAGRPCIRTRAS